MRSLTEITASSVRALGVAAANDAGFSNIATVRVGAVEGSSASMAVIPPPARVKLRAYMLPAGNGTLWALALSMNAHTHTRGAVRDTNRIGVA